MNGADEAFSVSNASIDAERVDDDDNNTDMSASEVGTDHSLVRVQKSGDVSRTVHVDAVMTSSMEDMSEQIESLKLQISVQERLALKAKMSSELRLLKQHLTTLKDTPSFLSYPVHAPPHLMQGTEQKIAKGYQGYSDIADASESSEIAVVWSQPPDHISSRTSNSSQGPRRLPPSQSASPVEESFEVGEVLSGSSSHTSRPASLRSQSVTDEVSDQAVTIHRCNTVVSQESSNPISYPYDTSTAEASAVTSASNPANDSNVALTVVADSRSLHASSPLETSIRSTSVCSVRDGVDAHDVLEGSNHEVSTNGSADTAQTVPDRDFLDIDDVARSEISKPRTSGSVASDDEHTITSEVSSMDHTGGMLEGGNDARETDESASEMYSQESDVEVELEAEHIASVSDDGHSADGSVDEV